MDWLTTYRQRLGSGLATRFRALQDLPFLRQLAPLLGRLAEAGTAGYPLETKRRLMILNMISYLIMVSTLVYAVQHAIIGAPEFRPIVLINFALVIVMLVVPFMHRFGEFAAAMLIIVSEFAAHLGLVAYLGNQTGLQIQLVGFSAAAFVVYGLRRIWLIVPTILAALALHLACWFLFPPEKALIAADRSVVDSLYIQAAITTFGIISATVYYAFRLAENARAETDALLRNILPDSIVERLKLRPSDPLADNFTEASILFADISGFVPLARKLGPGPTVELLNSMVSTFDDLSERHGVEKIKTIGDAYMAASGVPQPAPDFTLRLARLALEMQDMVRELRAERGLDLTIRIGIATGPVMAGVIGRQKFSYDIWGDAVNLAARLENTSLPGRIHVCPRTRDALLTVFELESRGPIDIKGVGQQETWFLGSVRPAG